MKLTAIFGKQIFSLYEGEILATISGATFNNNLNKIKSFKVFDNEENEYELLLNNIKAMTDYVLVTNKNKFEAYFDFTTKSPMFKLVLDSSATDLGKIIDAEIDSNGNVLYYITDQNKTLKPENIYIRKEFIYYSEVPVSLSNYRPKNKKAHTLSNIKVNVLELKPQENLLPKKLQYNPESILGKVAKSDLEGLNNEIIIKANQIITEKIISDATRHNRLNQLFYIAI